MVAVAAHDAGGEKAVVTGPRFWAAMESEAVIVIVVGAGVEVADIILSSNQICMFC